MAKLSLTQQQLRSQGEALADGLDAAAKEVTDSVVRMTEQVRQFIERKRAETRRPSRDNLKPVKP